MTSETSYRKSKIRSDVLFICLNLWRLLWWQSRGSFVRSILRFGSWVSYRNTRWFDYCRGLADDFHLFALYLSLVHDVDKRTDRRIWNKLRHLQSIYVTFIVTWHKRSLWRLRWLFVEDSWWAIGAYNHSLRNLEWSFRSVITDAILEILQMPCELCLTVELANSLMILRNALCCTLSNGLLHEVLRLAQIKWISAPLIAFLISLIQHLGFCVSMFWCAVQFL